MLTAPGDDRLFIVEQDGRIAIAQAGKLRAKPFADLRGVVTSGGEQGLLSVAFHPDFATNGRLFVYFTAKSQHEQVWELHAKAGSSSISGARTLILDMAVRDPGGQPVREARLRPGVRLGLGAPQPVALLVRREDGRPLDRRRRPGPREEVDHVAKGEALGANFGWSRLEGTHGYDPSHALTGGGRLVSPIAQYSHDDGCSMTGGYLYRGPSIPTLDGRYVYGDYCSSRLWTIAAGAKTPRDDSAIAKAAGLSAPTGFGVGPDGTLYVVSQGGALYRFASA